MTLYSSHFSWLYTDSIYEQINKKENISDFKSKKCVLLLLIIPLNSVDLCIYHANVVCVNFAVYDKGSACTTIVYICITNLQSFWQYLKTIFTKQNIQSILCMSVWGKTNTIMYSFIFNLKYIESIYSWICNTVSIFYLYIYLWIKRYE